MLGRNNPPRLSQRASPGFCQFVYWFVPRIFLNIVLTMMLTARVIAGPLEDAWTAYERGDYATALQIWRPRAEEGVAVAQNNLGLMYYNGQGVPQDYGEAAKWYRLAAEQGNATAQSNLGSMYYSGEGVPQDYIQAYMWVTLAASRFPPSAREDREQAALHRDLVASKMTSAQIAEARKRASEWKPKPAAP
jgi:TPR repeat protein